MFARSIAVLGAASIFAATAGDADARGRRHGCCQTTACYQKVMTPPVYKTVMVKVMVQPERCTLVSTPAVYKTQQQQVVVQPARQVVHTTPAVYGRVQETVQVRAGYTRWKTRRSRRGCCGVEYRCAVTVPPKFATRTRRVQVQAASHWVETKPAVMGVVNRQVMVSPGSSRRVCQPAVYKTMAKQVMISAGTAQWVPVASACAQPVVMQQPVVVQQPVARVHHKRHHSYK